MTFTFVSVEYLHSCYDQDSLPFSSSSFPFRGTLEVGMNFPICASYDVMSLYKSWTVECVVFHGQFADSVPIFSKGTTFPHEVNYMKYVSVQQKL